jgi:membrane protein
MRTHASNGRHPAGLGDAAKQVAERASTIARLEARLAAVELKQKLASLTLGIALGLGAAILVLFGLGFLLASAAAGLATALPLWASLLIVGGALVLVAGALGLAALKLFRSGTPVPEQALAEAKLTKEALRTE